MNAKNAPATKRTRVAFAGTPEFARTVLAGLVAAGFAVPLVITRPDRPVGRSKEPQPSPVASFAVEHDVPLEKPTKIIDALATLRQAAPDILVVAAYGQILPGDVLNAPRHGALNVHGSILPAYRGASPIQQAILDGRDRTGVTVMKMDEGLDTGPILATAELPLGPEDTTATLLPKVAELGTRLLVATISGFLDGSVASQAQGSATTLLTRLITKADGRINWRDSAEKIVRLTRAMNPWPMAWSELDGQPFRILEAAATKGTRAPGTLAASPDAVTVGTADGLLVLRKVQPAGKPPMTAADFARGYHGAGRFV